MARKIKELDDTYCRALLDFSDTVRGDFWDSKVRGLKLRVGARGASWYYRHDYRDHGVYKLINQKVGTFPAVGVLMARDRARVLAAKVVERKPIVHVRSGTKLADAFEGYLTYLENKAAENGKPARWAERVRSFGRTMILPAWGNHTLSELSEMPKQIAEWHQTCAKERGAVSANHAARVLRAIYRREAGLDRGLNLAHAPTTGVKMSKEKREQKGLALPDFDEWNAARLKLAPVKQAYHLCCLLTGARPGELARTRWSDLDTARNELVIGGAKMGNNIPIPLTPEIQATLDVARKAAPKSDVIFPGCWNNPSRDGMPARGHALRRTYKTLATGLCKIPDDISAYLLGHVPEGMSQKYLLRWAMSSYPAIVDAQHKISKAIMAKLAE